MMNIPTFLLGVLALLLLSPAAATALRPKDDNISTLASGPALLSEIELLHESLSLITRLLSSQEVPDDSEVMKRTAKLVRRVRSLVYATEEYQVVSGLGGDPAMPDEERRVALRKYSNRANRQRERELIRKENRAALRGKSIEDVERMRVEREAMLKEEGRELYKLDVVAEAEEEQGQGGERGLLTAEELDSELERDLYEETTTFPECLERTLEQCIAILNAQLLELEIDAEMIVHEKRKSSGEGYNKVVIVTDMTAELVKGREGNGQVLYPFMWNDPVVGLISLGIDGRFDCHNKSPEECCALIKDSVAGKDVNGNEIECHIFVPFGGIGNKKRDNRIFINLSLDGRVHEPPIIQ